MSGRRRVRLDVRGRVQGVGFRPRVRALATSLGVTGFVQNTPGGVRIEVEGEDGVVADFIARVSALPAPVAIEDVRARDLPLAGFRRFVIHESLRHEPIAAPALADRAPCAACRAEVLGGGGTRRAGYAFLACAVCGPRAGIATALPWDRARTTMAPFPLCADCQREHDAVDDAGGEARFAWACGLSCPACGPRLVLRTRDGLLLSDDSRAIKMTADRVAAGAVVAVLGVGGFQVWADAARDDVLSCVREGKGRPTKPLALQAADLDHARRLITFSDDDSVSAALQDVSAPIVVAPRAPAAPISGAVAPTVDDLGVMLPASPLHLLLARALHARGVTAVVTSANRSGEPLCTDEEDVRALTFVDAVLTHDRAVARRLDDSVVRVVHGAPVLLRAGRGVCPAPVARVPHGPCLLALGAHMKTAPALTVPAGDDGAWDDVVLGAHVGTLDTAAARDALEDAARDLLRLTQQEPAAVVVDAHPDCGARAVAERFGVPIFVVQHHRAHAAAALAEYPHLADERDACAVVFDGVGYGDDGALWGGEWLDAATGARRAHLPAFALPGGESAIRDPRRQGLAVLVQLWGPERALAHPWTRRTFLRDGPLRADVLVRLCAAPSTPRTTGAGRWLDALAALLDVAGPSGFSGEAPLRLEQHARPAWRDALVDDAPVFSVDSVAELLMMYDFGFIESKETAAKVHAMLARAVVARAGTGPVVLGGGCMSNALLVAGVQRALSPSGRTAAVPRRVPPGDGGLAVGQIAAVRRWGGVSRGAG